MKKMAMGLLMALALIGCATIDKNTTLDEERMLAAAGFKMKPADTPEKRNNLLLLPQQQLVSRERDGKKVYVFADATTCLCLYVGNEKAYKRFEKLVMERRDAEQQAMAWQMQPEGGLDWDMWGPWDVDGPMDYYIGW